MIWSGLVYFVVDLAVGNNSSYKSGITSIGPVETPASIGVRYATDDNDREVVSQHKLNFSLVDHPLTEDRGVSLVVFCTWSVRRKHSKAHYVGKCLGGFGLKPFIGLPQGVSTKKYNIARSCADSRRLSVVCQVKIRSNSPACLNIIRLDVVWHKVGTLIASEAVSRLLERFVGDITLPRCRTGESIAGLGFGYGLFDESVGFTERLPHLFGLRFCGIRLLPSGHSQLMSIQSTSSNFFQALDHYVSLISVHCHGRCSNENKQKVKPKLSAFVFTFPFLLFSLACFKIGNAAFEKNGWPFVVAITGSIVLFVLAQCSAYCILRALLGQ